ncbi:MAG: glycoside hydrolase family 3 C-terminal domain-containing protein [Acutalibacteraceae bacterium]
MEVKNMKHQDILDKMTLEEKASLCSGKDFWHLKGIERLGLKEIMITDGPHGLRKQNPDGKGSSLENSVETTCFPTAATTACSWDPELLYEMGQAMGEECLAEKVSVILGPGANMKRSPLCGRNFEYFSEDPVLAGEMAAGLINGVQSKNVGTSLKHFAANNQEKRRMTISTVADERTLREIYLTAFEIAVKKGKPWTVMNAYNKINGIYCSDNAMLQQIILRDEWGFDGIVMTDWGAANDRVRGIVAGNDLEMPSSGGLNDEKICQAVRRGDLSIEILDKRVDDLLDLILKSQETLCDFEYDKKAHHELARKVGSQSMVLLKNEDAILPLKKDQKIAVIGEMARSPRYQGAGSSQINPTEISDAFDELIKEGFNPLYAPGYDKSRDVVSQTLINDACAAAKKADTVLLFIGLTECYESEGFDRTHMDLPVSHNKLAQEILKVNKNVVVVLSGGAPVTMPWLNDVKAVLNAYLGGQASGQAIVDILSGKVNPSGKLAETYPLSLDDTPCRKYFPGNMKTVEYRESVYIGYRYYDTAMKDVLFPFGFGLSYTTFEYSALKLSKKKIKDTDTLTVSYKVKNTGSVAGSEISQVYVSDVESTIYRPVKELKGFAKTHLEPGEEKTVEIMLDKRAFAYYNVKIGDWHVESGEFDILVGASSRDIRLEGKVTVTSTQENVTVPDYRESAPDYYTADVAHISDSEFESVLGFEIPPKEHNREEELTLLNSLEDAKYTTWGGRVYALVDKAISLAVKGDSGTAGMVRAMAVEIPIRNFVTMSGGVFSPEMAEGLLLILNDKAPARGLGKIVSGLVGAIKNLPGLLKSI